MSEPERKFIAPTVGEFDQLNDALTTAMVTMVECYKGRPRGSLSEIEQAVLPFLKIVAQYQGMTLQALGVLVDMTIGPVYEQRDTYYLGATPGRLLIRKQTIAALVTRGMVRRQRMPDDWHAAHITEVGRAGVVNHPLRLELACAR